MQEFDASQHLEELGELWERPAMAERATKRPRLRGRGQVNRNKSMTTSSSRRENSRIAAKNRRENENIEIYELARLLPLPSAVTSQLDKASVLRITISYFKMKKFFDKADKGWLFGPLSIHPSQTYGKYGPCDPLDMPRLRALPRPEDPARDTAVDEHIDHYTLQALDGFIMVLSSAGDILYVSETVSGHLGHSQVDLLGRSVFEYSHVQDHDELKEALKPHAPCVGQKDMVSSGIGDRQTRDSPGKGSCSGRHVSCRNERNFCLRIKNSLNKKGGEKKGINCPGYKVIHLAGRTRFANGEEENPCCLGLLAVCKPLDPPPMMEVSLSSNLFMSRHSLDLRFIFCDQRISQLTGYHPSDMLGRVVYHFHHPNDMSTIAGCHSNLIAKGQSVSKSYRFLMKTGNWMWLQTKAVISYNTRSQKAQFITCYNYVVSEDQGKRQLLDMGDTNDEWKKMRPVVELSVVQPSHSSRKSIRKRQSLTTSSDGSVQRMTPKDHAQEPVQSETASPGHTASSNSLQSLPMLQPTTLTPSSKDSSHPVELDIFDQSPLKLGEAIAQGYLATITRKSSDESQPLVMTDIPPDIIGASITRVVVTKRTKRRKADNDKACEACKDDNPSTSDPPQSDLDGVMTDLSLNIEEDLIHDFHTLSPGDPDDIKPSCANGLFPPMPGSYQEPCLQHSICQTPTDDLSHVSASGYPMMVPISQQVFPGYFHPPVMTVPEVSNGMRYHGGGIHMNGVISNGQAWAQYPPGPMHRGPVIFSPGYPNLAGNQQTVLGGRRSGLETVQYPPYPQSYYRMASSSGGLSCQMNGRRISPPESCAPHLGNETIQ